MENQSIKELLKDMTIEEKIGQLIQLTPDYFSKSGEITGPMEFWKYNDKELSMIGSILGTQSAEQVYQIQKNYLEKSRLKIPLLFMADIIHGYETIFPIPLALAASFNPKVIEIAASLSAKEATEAGIQVTFSPMVDHVKDSRWGRVMESNGEDPTLSSALARAYVRGYQGENLSSDFTKVACCLKHFIGYGGVEGGRDYNHVDFSDWELYQNYLPAFRAAIEEGAKLTMTSFNAVKGIPSTGNQEILRDILRTELNFEGVIISDWSAVAELIAHRVAENPAQAARMAFDASVDIDMVSDCYQHYLADQLTETDMDKLDEGVMRILTLKNELGLFEDPYRGLRKIYNSNSKFTDSEEIHQQAREIAQKTIVLLKNEQKILPINHSKSIALIGSKACTKDLLGGWSYKGDLKKVISLTQGLQEKNLSLTVAGTINQNVISKDEKQKMLRVAAENEIVILALGEMSQEIGENKSKADTTLSLEQTNLIKEIAEINENLVLVLFNGRPLVLTEIESYVKAILVAWFPGTEGGRAIADILVGDANPQAKLPMSFPRSSGQLPFSYQLYSTGRPAVPDNEGKPYVTRYLDVKNTALYSFGHGLSYSTFEYGNLNQSSSVITEDEALIISLTIKNTSNIEGTEIVQLYLEDCISQVVRPMIELKQWQIVSLVAGEQKEVIFTITEADLRYIHKNLENTADSGHFCYRIGSDSISGLSGSFEFQESR